LTKALLKQKSWQSLAIEGVQYKHSREAALLSACVHEKAML